MRFLPKLSSQECWCFLYSVTFPAGAFHRVFSSFLYFRNAEMHSQGSSVIMYYYNEEELPKLFKIHLKGWPDHPLQETNESSTSADFKKQKTQKQVLNKGWRFSLFPAPTFCFKLNPWTVH